MDGCEIHFAPPKKPGEATAFVGVYVVINHSLGFRINGAKEDVATIHRGFRNHRGFRLASLGPPVVPFLTPFLVGRVPLLK